MPRPTSTSSSAASWLSQLPANPIFDLPTRSTTSELPRPASPQLSHLFPAPSLAKRARTAADNSGEAHRTSRMVLARGVDLIVAVGQELRLSSLAEAKGHYEDSEVFTGSANGYKVLHTPVIDFEIQQLVLNPTSKLLAVMGRSQVALVVLPRKGWNNIVGSRIECRSLLVGKFYHFLPASPAIAQVAFHEWGENGSSLLVLTQDSILREYSVGQDTEEPAQVIDFCQEAGGSTRQGFESSRNGQGYGMRRPSRKPKSGFSADDEDASSAVGFCFGAGRGDWGSLTVYGLMKNGDILAVCPFLPKRASLPAAYIHSLAYFVSSKVDYLASIESTALVSNASSHMEFASLYSRQLKYVNALVRQIPTTRSLSKMPVLNVQMDESDTLEEDLDRMIAINAPTTFDGKSTKLKRQGPFLLQPAPRDLDTALDSAACDIAYINYSGTGAMSTERVQEDDLELGVFVVSYSDGKVDICVEVEKVEAKWSTSSGDEGDEEDDLPVLAVYETIDLGLVASLPESQVEHVLSHNWTTIIKDPLYHDILYVHHALGSHCLSLAKWLESLALATLPLEDEDEDTLQQEVERSLKRQESTEVLWILKTVSLDKHDAIPRVEGIALVNDVYLGYSILIITDSLQLVAIELSLRVDSSLLIESAADASIAAPPRGLSSDPPAYLSLLDTSFVVPALLDRRSGVSAVPRLAIKTPSTGKAQLTITPDSLRFIGKTVETLRHEIRDLVAAADSVQNRLELQMKELSRQLGKLRDLSSLSNNLRKSISTSTAAALGAGGEPLAQRLQRVSTRQAALLARTDHLLQQLINAHQPLLSTYETKWFDELGRLEREVLGNERGLVQRVENIGAKVGELRPALEQMKREEEQARVIKLGTKRTVAADSLGKSQLVKLQSMLTDEAKLIIEARRKIDRLTTLLASTTL